jgi:peptidoglycan/xylan/chitin deacetylase (PgdA/CDA1 family)
MDNAELAFPILQSLGIKATIYLSTGLMENPGYLTWAQVETMQATGTMSFGNHTWSHRNVSAKPEIVKYEISTADRQLAEKGLNSLKTFVYPYGFENQVTEKLLKMECNQPSRQFGENPCEKQRLSHTDPDG